MNWLRKFMYGRYGSDPLNMALLILALVLNFIPYFFARIISIALLVFIFYRMCSKNIYKRQQENAVFLRLTDKITPHLILFKDRLRDVKTKRYRRCPCCKNVLRLPYKRGKHNVKCPKCGKDFSVHIL